MQLTNHYRHPIQIAGVNIPVNTPTAVPDAEYFKELAHSDSLKDIINKGLLSAYPDQPTKTSRKSQK